MSPLLILLHLLLNSFGQLSLAQYTCLSSGHVVTTDLPSCDYLNNTYSSCNNVIGDDLNNCVCTQQLLSSIFDCESEYRICLDSHEEDNAMQQVLANWHSGCDKFITFSPTTPVLSTPTFTIGNPACSAIESICTFGGSITRACKESFTASIQIASLSSCLCQSSLLSAASVCEYDGNITCNNFPATLADIDLWILCPAQVAALSTLSPTTTSFSSLSSNSLLPAASSSPFQASSSRRSSSSFSVALSNTAASLSSPASTKAATSPTTSSSAFRRYDGLGYTTTMVWVLASLARFILVMV
ncbi:hypothetical protein V8E51_007257 [Hyaloscypha variabilis]